MMNATNGLREEMTDEKKIAAQVERNRDLIEFIARFNLLKLIYEWFYL